MYEPLLSIILPVHNGKPFLEETLQSVLDQTLPRRFFELLVVDDGSDDGTGELLQAFAGKRPWVRLLATGYASGAAGAPRNLGLAAAAGKYIQFLDADDALLPDACEFLCEGISEQQADILSGTYALMNGDQGPAMLYRRLFPEPLVAVRADAHPQVLAAPPAVWSRVFSAEFLRRKAILFPEGVIAQDAVFMVEALLRAERVSTIPDVVCRYRLRGPDDPLSMSSRRDPAFFRDLCTTRFMIRDLFEKWSCLDYYELFYGEHLRYYLDRLVPALLENRLSAAEAFTISSSLFTRFRALDLDQVPLPRRVLIELLGLGMEEEFGELIACMRQAGGCA